MARRLLPASKLEGSTHANESCRRELCSMGGVHARRRTMTFALVLFGLAAVGGLVMATQRFKGADRPSLGIALVHGAAAAAGLIALLIAVVSQAAPPLAKTALVVF